MRRTVPLGAVFFLQKKTPKGLGIVVRNYLFFLVLRRMFRHSFLLVLFFAFSGLGIPYHADFFQQLFFSGGDHSFFVVLTLPSDSLTEPYAVDHISC